MDNSVVISLKGVNKTFVPVKFKTIRERFLDFKSINYQRKSIEALKNINFEVYQGETFGVIGRNGSGKSTLIHLIMGSMIPDKGGKITTKGKKIRLSLGMGVDPNLSARDNIYVNGSILGLSFKTIGQKFNEIIEFAGLEEFIDLQVKNYSKGMKARLNFSIAMHADADIFLLDEFFGGVGDEDFKEKSDQAFHQRIIEGKTNVIVSHSMPIIENYCQRVMWVNQGQIEEIGEPATVIKNYKASFLKPNPIKK